MSEFLLVMLHDRPAGELRRTSGSLEFTYLDGYIASDGPPISQSLPVRAETYGNRICTAVFGGVLPEQDVRRAVAGWLGVSSTNDYKLLEELGGDCAGALEFLVDGVIPDQCSLSRPLDADTLDRIVRDLPQRPIPQLEGDEDDHIRMSLAGAQSKLPVIATENVFALPGSHGQPSTHIIKPEPVHFPGLVANEAFCMSLARLVELEVAKATPVMTIGQLPYLFVERYDRDLLQSPVRRLHQEDMCQALGLQPDQKYQKEGGPSVAAIVELIRAVSAAPTQDIGKLWDALIFNVTVGNCDAHGKNYSLLYDGHRPKLAPLYDLVATAVYPDVTNRLAMSIGSAKRLDDVTVEAWAACAEACGLSPTSAVQRVRRLAADIRSGARVMTEALLESDAAIGATAASITAGIEARARRWGVAE
jgi:serine/threonine-protein kinase HipA